VVTRVFVWLLGCSVWLSGYYEFVVYTILGGCQAGMWLLVCLCGYLLEYSGWLSSSYVATRTFVWLQGCSVWLPGYYKIVVYTVLGGCQAGMWLLECDC